MVSRLVEFDREEIITLNDKELILKRDTVPTGMNRALVCNGEDLFVFRFLKITQGMCFFTLSGSFPKSNQVQDGLLAFGNSKDLVQGYVEGVRDIELFGWAASPFCSIPMQLALKLNGIVVDIKACNVFREDIAALCYPATLHEFSFQSRFLGHPLDKIEVEVLGFEVDLQWVRANFDSATWPERRKATFKQRNYSGLEFERSRCDKETGGVYIPHSEGKNKPHAEISISVSGPIELAKCLGPLDDGNSIRWAQSIYVLYQPAYRNDINKLNTEFFARMRQLALPRDNVHINRIGFSETAHSSVSFNFGHRGYRMNIPADTEGAPLFDSPISQRAAVLGYALSVVRHGDVEFNDLIQTCLPLDDVHPIIIKSESEQTEDLETVLSLVFGRQPLQIKIGTNQIDIVYLRDTIRLVQFGPGTDVRHLIDATIDEYEYVTKADAKVFISSGGNSRFSSAMAFADQPGVIAREKGLTLWVRERGKRIHASRVARDDPSLSSWVHAAIESAYELFSL